MRKGSLVRYAVAWIIRELGFSPEDVLSERKYARFAIQKVAYLMKFLGVPEFRDLSFDLYIMGPYSKELADIYYDLARGMGEDGIEELAMRYGTCVPSEVRKYVWYFAKKPHWWMEIAATILMLWERYGRLQEKELYRLLRSAKPWIDQRMFRQVYSGLTKIGLIK